MDIATPANATQRPPTTIEVRPTPSGRAHGTSADAASDTTTAAKPERSFWQQAFGDDGFSFGTLLDIVNPLQHIPIVSTIYQKLTGDETSPGANIIGGALFGGPVGLMVAAADSALKVETGKDTGGHVFALFDSSTPADTAVADAGAPKPAAASDTAATEAHEASSAASDASPSQATDMAAAPLVADAPKAAASTPAQPASDVPRSAFVLANSQRHTPGHGVGGAFVPFETRSTIAPPSLFAPVAFGFAAPADAVVSKRGDKTATPTVPDPKALAANPAQMKKLWVDGMRPAPATKPVPLESRALAGAAQTSPAMNGVGPSLPANNDLGGGSDGFADLMARNIERYLSLKNKRPAPSHINQSF